MKKRSIYVIMVVAALFLARLVSFAQAPVNPVSKDAWILNLGLGAAADHWGNGYGFGPGGKLAFEKGMWKVGPGVFTLGGEIGLSFFWHKWVVGNYDVFDHHMTLNINNNNRLHPPGAEWIFRLYHFR